MRPRLSYTIWFSQRTGSTLLCKSLAATGIAGRPDEILYNHLGQDLLVHYGLDSDAQLQEHLWQLGSTPNGTFGVKVSMYEPYFSQLLDTFRRFPGCPRVSHPRPAVWNHAFPNCRHIFMTRRNKVRLAVSWWKAIKTQEWQRVKGAPAASADLSDAYHYDAINHLYNECSMREAGIQAFLAEADIVPLTVVYEDFIQEYEATLRRILAFLDLDPDAAAIPEPHYERLADDVSEAWVQRFREERQQGWTNRGW